MYFLFCQITISLSLFFSPSLSLPASLSLPFSPTLPLSLTVCLPLPVWLSFPLSHPLSSSLIQVKMTRMRQRIAQRLKEAQNVNAMLTTFNEVDMRSESDSQSHLLEYAVLLV